MKIRALRRQRYFKKIYNQKAQWAERTKGGEATFSDNQHEQRAVRLTEDGMKYEALIMYKNFNGTEANQKYMKI